MTATLHHKETVDKYKISLYSDRIERNQRKQNMSNADGGPAFPRPYTPGSGEKQDGMSLRDYFAAKAMHGLAILYFPYPSRLQ
jgi:hypothetical protein